MIQGYGFMEYVLPEKYSSAECVEIAKTSAGSCGAVCYSTCDRSEIWFSGDEIPPNPFADENCYKVGPSHLFRVASGLESPMFGEDRIISQLTAAASAARLSGITSPELEMLFRSAVTCGKEVHSSVRLETSDETLLGRVAEIYSGCPSILIIGSGSLSRAIAERLIREGHSVTMTLRSISKASELLPSGAVAASYDERYSLASGASAIISASSGIGYTLEKGAVIPEGAIVSDLASIPDIEPGIHAKVLRDEILSIGRPDRDAAVKKAEAIIARYLKEFETWLDFRRYIPDVPKMANAAALDTLRRLETPIKKLGLGKDAEEALRASVLSSSSKAFAHQLYFARDGKLDD